MQFWDIINPGQFETLCVKIMEKFGFSNVKRLPVAWGVDIEAVYQIPNLSSTMNVAAQCKLRTDKQLWNSHLSNTYGYIFSKRPNIFILFTNTDLAKDASDNLNDVCKTANCILEIKGRKWIDDFVVEKNIPLTDIITSDGYLGRIDRAKYIIRTTEDVIEDYKKRKRKITVRIRAAFTSISNIQHYYGKNINGLSCKQAKGRFPEGFVTQGKTRTFLQSVFS